MGATYLVALLGTTTASRWLATRSEGWRRLDGVVLLAWAADFYRKVFASAQELSDKYRETVEGQRGAGPRLSGLHQSWLSGLWGGRPNDLKDAQYHGFRDKLPLLVTVMAVYLLGATLVRRRCRDLPVWDTVRYRSWYIAACGLAAGFVFHEACLLKVLIAVAANYALCHWAVRSQGGRAPGIMWAFNIAIMVANETYGGYRWSHIFGGSELARYLDGRRGDFAWHHSYNLVMLRLMSFNMDFYWQQQAKGNGKAVGKPRRLDERSRTQEHQPSYAYRSPVLYLSYLFYLPLFIAGPTITFNNFCSHLVMPQRSYDGAGKARYALRFVCVLLLFESLTHFVYAGAISYMAFRFPIREGGANTPLLVHLARTGGVGSPLDYEQVVAYSYCALMYLWFKFLLIWRFFRLWAVLDDVEPVENMERCMNNNYTIAGFWRSWHRSFNRWLVRYVYVPLGGDQRKVFNVLVVFTFVAFWHDVKPQLFAWSWLLSLFYVPELLATRIGRLDAVQSWGGRHPMLLEWAVCFCGAANVLMLKAANIVGYTTGLDGGRLLLESLLGTPTGVLFMLQYWTQMAVGVRIMRYIAELRARKH